VLFDIKGADLKEVLKNAAIRGEGSFPYTAGLRYSADLSKKEEGFFTRLDVQTDDGWVPIEDETIYHIAANSFIASGKDDYKQFGAVKDKEDTGFTNAEVFMEYLKEFKTVTHSEPRVSLVR
jgi:5'-nucleotidase